MIYSDPTGHTAAANGGLGPSALYNLSNTNVVGRIIDARSASPEAQAKLLKELLKDNSFGFYGDDSGGMTRNQFEYLYKLAMARESSNFSTAK